MPRCTNKFLCLLTAYSFNSPFRSVFKYKPSTFSRAHGVFLKKVRLDFIDGFSIKHLMRIICAKPDQLYVATSCSSIIFKVIPCNGLLGCCSFKISVVIAVCLRKPQCLQRWLDLNFEYACSELVFYTHVLIAFLLVPKVNQLIPFRR